MVEDCALCGEPQKQYVVLNRWAAISGTSDSLIAGPGTYKWAPKSGECSGYVLCLTCIHMWAEAQILAVEIRSRRRGVE